VLCSLLGISAVTLAAFLGGEPGSTRRAAVAREAAQSGGDKDGASSSGLVEAEVVGLAAPRPQSAETEVVSETGSRPTRLIYSKGVQQLISVLGRLNAAPGEGSDTALKVFLNNAVTSLGNLDDDSKLPLDIEADINEFQEEDLGEKPLAKFARLRIVKQMPEYIDRTIPWDTVFPDNLAEKSGVTQTEVREGFRAFVNAVDLEEIADWTDDEAEEAFDLVQRSSELREVYSVVEKAVEDAMTKVLGTVTAFAAAAVLTPFLILGLLVAACFACFGGFGGGGGTDVVPDAGTLPLYRLGQS